MCAFRGGNGEFELDYARLGQGEVHTVYPQQDLVTDLIAEYLDRGGELRFGVTVTDVDARTATIGYRDANGTGRVTGRFLAGCDGSNGVTRRAMPETATRHCQDHGVAWLAVLAEAPQSMAAVTYAIHDDGFAGHMARSPEVTRYYLQVPPDDDPEAWTDDRIWAALDTLVVERLLPDSGGDSLAIRWDVHMLCNTGGRERTESHYRALLVEAGFDVVETHPLPLDAHLVHARRRG